MLGNTFILSGRSPGDPRRADFIREVRVRETPRRPVAVFDGLMVLFWALMLTKCVLCTWAVGYWDMPVSSFWVWLPSLVFGAVCTVLYVSRD